MQITLADDSCRRRCWHRMKSASSRQSCDCPPLDQLRIARLGTTVHVGLVQGTHAVVGMLGQPAYMVQGDTGAIEQITVRSQFGRAMVMAVYHRAEPRTTDEEYPLPGAWPVA